MQVKVLALGTWSIRSKSDPRWDGGGQGMVGMFAIPEGAKEYIERKKQELQEEPPADLMYSYMKY